MAKFAKEVVEPKVFEMDENEKMSPEIIKGLYGESSSQPHAEQVLTR